MGAGALSDGGGCGAMSHEGFGEERWTAEHLYSSVMVERGTEWHYSDVEHRWRRRPRETSGASEDSADSCVPIQSTAHGRSSSIVRRSKG
jgi:hypothetical protein